MGQRFTPYRAVTEGPLADTAVRLLSIKARSLVVGVENDEL
jgi:hypothetical protein